MANAKSDQSQFSCVLTESQCYRETLKLRSIAAVPGLIELTLETELFSSSNPDESRVKSRTCLTKSQLKELHLKMGRYLHDSEQV